MRKALLLLLALSLLLCVTACEEEPAEQPQPGVRFLTVNIAEYDLIVLRHYKGTKEEGEVSFLANQSAPNAPIWQELVRELQGGSYFPADREFDYSEYFRLSVYSGGGSAQYVVDFSVNGACEVEFTVCSPGAGSVDFARMAEYFTILGD